MTENLAATTDAVILVGGKGTRLRPLTNSIPKPMLPTAGFPFLQHLLARIKDAGMTHVVLGTSFKAEVFEEFFGDGSEFGLEIEYVVEDEPLGTGGGIRNVASRLRHDRAMVFNGDVLGGTLHVRLEGLGRGQARAERETDHRADQHRAAGQLARGQGKDVGGFADRQGGIGKEHLDLLGTQAVDVEGKVDRRVAGSGGGAPETLSYGTLVLATGLNPRTLPFARGKASAIQAATPSIASLASSHAASAAAS